MIDMLLHASMRFIKSVEKIRHTSSTESITYYAYLQEMSRYIYIYIFLVPVNRKTRHMKDGEKRSQKVKRDVNSSTCSSYTDTPIYLYMGVCKHESVAFILFFLVTGGEPSCNMSSLRYFLRYFMVWWCVGVHLCSAVCTKQMEVSSHAKKKKETHQYAAKDEQRLIIHSFLPLYPWAAVVVITIALFQHPTYPASCLKLPSPKSTHQPLHHHPSSLHGQQPIDKTKKKEKIYKVAMRGQQQHIWKHLKRKERIQQSSLLLLNSWSSAVHVKEKEAN